MRRMDGALGWSRNLGEEQELGMNSKAAILPIQFNSIQFNFNPRHLTCLLSFLPFSPISPHSSPTSPSTVLLLLLLRALHACISSESPHKPQSTPTIQQWSHKCGMKCKTSWWRIQFVQECGGFKRSNKGGGEQSATATLERMMILG
jgi:hypothetical protein